MPTVGPAFQFLEQHGANMFGLTESMLYVGHRSDTHPWWRTEFARAIGSPRLAVLDILQTNLDTASGFASELIHGDIRTAQVSGYSLVFWDEGPEHVARDEALDTLRTLAIYNDHVLVSCPWGHQPQGSGPDDPEFHHWAPQPADFESIGFQTAAFGTMFDGRGGGHGNLLAWI